MRAGVCSRIEVQLRPSGHCGCSGGGGTELLGPEPRAHASLPVFLEHSKQRDHPKHCSPEARANTACARAIGAGGRAILRGQGTARPAGASHGSFGGG